MQEPAILHHDLGGSRAQGSAVEAYPCPCPTLCLSMASAPAGLSTPYPLPREALGP
jgi:hypothetical protein